MFDERLLSAGVMGLINFFLRLISVQMSGRMNFPSKSKWNQLILIIKKWNHGSEGTVTKRMTTKAMII